MIFKTDEIKREYPKVKERLRLILEDIDMFHKDHGYIMVVTDLISTEGEDAKLKRVSSSHREGRAADLRTKHLPQKFIKKLIDHFSVKYIEWAAISARTRKPALIVYHNGTALHFHVQIRPYEGS